MKAGVTYYIRSCQFPTSTSLCFLLSLQATVLEPQCIDSQGCPFSCCMQCVWGIHIFPYSLPPKLKVRSSGSCFLAEGGDKRSDSFKVLMAGCIRFVS